MGKKWNPKFDLELKGKTKETSKSLDHGLKPGYPDLLPMSEAEFRDRCKTLMPHVLDTIAQVLQSADSDTAKINACKTLIEQAYGKAPSKLEVTGGEPIKIAHVQIHQIDNRLKELLGGEIIDVLPEPEDID